MIRRRPDNTEIADVLERVAELLEANGTDAWRIRAWRAGATTLRTLERDVVSILDEEGPGGLVALPAIGKSLSAAIGEYVETGRLALLDRLEETLPPEGLFRTVPGIGEDLARRIHETLGIRTLEDLEVAAHDGRLDRVPGFGPRRVQAVRESLQGLLARASARRARRFAARPPASAGPPAPDVRILLAVDAEYREGAAAGRLRRIPPRRFNPGREAWLPVLETEREGRTFTAMFSNTARAHELGTTRDWVLISWSEAEGEGRATVVTERQGPLRGRRVVRGREAECRAHYAREDASA